MPTTFFLNSVSIPHIMTNIYFLLFRLAASVFRYPSVWAWWRHMSSSYQSVPPFYLIFEIWNWLRYIAKQWTTYTSILSSIKVFIYQLMHNRVASKDIKIYIKKVPTCFGLITIIRERTVHHTYTHTHTLHTHTHQYRPNKICSHTTEPTTTMYFKWLF